MADQEQDMAKAMDDTWSTIDKTNQGFLDQEEAKQFIETTLKELGIPGDLDDDGFATIFDELDKDGSGRISKSQMIDFFSNFMGFFVGEWIAGLVWPNEGEATMHHGVKIVNFEFLPAHITLHTGHAVTWTHANPHAHVHSINSEDGCFESPELAFGQQYTQSFVWPGTYRYYCHRNSFMMATVTVVDPAPLLMPLEPKMSLPSAVPSSRTDTHRMTTFDAFVHAASLNQTTVVQRWQALLQRHNVQWWRLYRIDKGHAVDHEDSDGQRALCLAAQNQCMDTMALLVQHGADVRLPQRGGRTALHEACTWGKPLAVALLIAHGANVNTRDCSGQVPLHCACQNGDPALVRLLLDAVADPYIADEHRRIPQNIAHDWKRLDALQELHEYSAKAFRKFMGRQFALAMRGVTRDIPAAVQRAIFEFLA
ncbi:Aste57867_21695 [Aphanomyces stellatus]|uniref:Aste57867_21695 protein n=1 Tax=Aphanomyces stellatus TaxID=120398 RepID=A0A485LJJ0_9STRA|nr:hypothetical protein As57867_021626 [Aphanomyces stellatus]VFT98364.1 Aste57867_21695 [Aphanomyces stellatus]